MKTKFFFAVMITLALSTLTVSAQVGKKKKNQNGKSTATEQVLKAKKSVHIVKAKKN